jgi:chitinase
MSRRRHGERIRTHLIYLMLISKMQVWASSTDDFQGNAATALNKALGRNAFSVSQLAAQKAPTGQCVWGECRANPICDPGLSPAQRSDGKNQGNAGIYTGCPDGQQRNYCW